MRKALLALILTFVAYGYADAADSLLKYEQRVKRAAEQVERIKKDKSYASEGIAYLRVLLPKYEQIDYDGQLVTVDNTWLHTLLDSYEHAGPFAGDSSKLNEAEGKLKALDEHLVEAQRQETSSHVVDDKTRALRDILSRSEYKPKPEDPFTLFLRNVKNRIFEAVGRLLQALARSVFGAAMGQGWVMMTLIIIVLAAVLALLVRTLIKTDFRKKKPQTRKVLGEEIPENITARDLAAAAMAAARGGDFRIGIRKLYIACLYELADRGLIDLESNATNRDYFRLVSRHSMLSSPMEYLTDKFEYFWYGKYQATGQDFQDYLNRYGVISDRARSVTA